MIKEILRDERGTPSAARTFLFGSLVFTGTIIVLDSTIWDVPEPAYVLLGIAKAVKSSPRRPSLLDNDPEFKEHDEK